MRLTLVAAIAVFGLCATALPGSAHHSFAGEFDVEKPIKLQGTITRVEWINPHAWIHIDVKKPDGTVESWAIEGGTPNTLFRRGITRDSVKAGMEIQRRRLSGARRNEEGQRPGHHAARRPEAVLERGGRQ